MEAVHESIVILVRVWLLGRGEQGFRATARRVDREDARTFTRSEELVRYLTEVGMDDEAVPKGPDPNLSDADDHGR